jgi:pantoate--beta-alanine ligase
MYLSATERKEAPRLYQVLKKARDEIVRGARDFQRIDQQAMSELWNNGWLPDYVAVRRQADLRQPTERDHDLVVVAAARLGRTRLIDNVELRIEA